MQIFVTETQQDQLPDVTMSASHTLVHGVHKEAADSNYCDLTHTLRSSCLERCEQIIRFYCGLVREAHA